MGASSYTEEIKIDDAWFKDAWQHDRDYYGSNPYSGSLATLSGARSVYHRTMDRRQETKLFIRHGRKARNQRVLYRSGMAGGIMVKKKFLIKIRVKNLLGSGTYQKP